MEMLANESTSVQEVFIRYLGRESILRCWSESTRKSYRLMCDMLADFDPQMQIGGMGKEVLEDLYIHFVSKNLGNRTIKYYLTLTMTFLRWAQKNGYPVDPTWKDFAPRLKTVPKTVVWLDYDELMQMINHPRDEWTQTWKNVADYFLLSCFTGLRARDLNELRWSDLEDGRIRVVTSKTSAPLTIELNSFSKAMIHRQKTSKKAGGYILPRVDMTNINTVLKRIAREVGLNRLVTVVRYRAGSVREEIVVPKWQELSMHCGRRTFICNALSLGISPLTVMRWTGHKSYSSMKPYIDISDSEKARAMSRFNELAKTTKNSAALTKKRKTPLENKK